MTGTLISLGILTVAALIAIGPMLARVTREHRDERAREQAARAAERVAGVRARRR